MPKKEIEVGDIRPIYNISGFEVCKIASDKKEEIQWTPVERINEAEVLSFIYRREKPVKNKKAGRPKKEIEEVEEDEKEIDDEDL